MKQFKWFEFNVNDYVKVKLTKKGFGILAKYYEGEIPKWFENYSEGNGYYRFQLHVLMDIFGSEMYNGNPKLPFNNNIYFDLIQNV